MIKDTHPIEISVVLPVYNGATTLACALRSVFAQTLQNYEIVLLDDGSTDNSVKVAETFSDHRLHIIKDGTNRGLAYRLNQGIDLARGRYIARMDADDICFPKRLERQFDFLETHSTIDLLGCRAIVFRGGKEIIGLMPFRAAHEEICARPWSGLYLCHPTWMGRAEWFRRHRYRFPEVLLAEDQDLLLRTYPTSQFACLEDVLLAYRKENFHLGKTLRARRSLLNTQLTHFLRRHQYFNAVLAIGITGVKIIVDCLAAVPGCEAVFFRRMSEPVSASVTKELQLIE